MKYLFIVWLIVLSITITGCRTTGVYGEISKVITAEGRTVPIEISAHGIVTLELNYFSDYDISTIAIEVKKCVSAWFWCWLIFTALMCGLTELAVFIPYGIGKVFAFIGKRWSTLVWAIAGWLFIRYIMGGGYIFTTSVTGLVLITANCGWELIWNSFGRKIKERIMKKNS